MFFNTLLPVHCITPEKLCLKRYKAIIKKRIYALSRLSFNTIAVKVRKTAQFQESHFFHDKKRLVKWHDVNNSLSSYLRNNIKPLTHSQLIAVHERYQERIEPIIYGPWRELLIFEISLSLVL